MNLNVLFGRLFQVAGLILLPIGLYIGMVNRNVPMEVRVLFIGGAFVVIGWLTAREKH
jgi:hypothetical protein